MGPNPTFKKRQLQPALAGLRTQGRSRAQAEAETCVQQLRGGAWPPSPLTPATLRPRTDPSAVPAPAGRPSPDPGRRPPPAAPPRRPHQCQLFTLVPSSRSSTIQRRSPWPHLAMAARAAQTGRKTRRGQSAAAPKPAFLAAELRSGAFAAPSNCQKAPPRRGAPGSSGRDLRGGSYGDAEAGRG